MTRSTPWLKYDADMDEWIGDRSRYGLCGRQVNRHYESDRAAPMRLVVSDEPLPESWEASIVTPPSCAIRISSPLAANVHPGDLRDQLYHFVPYGPRRVVTVWIAMEQK